MEHLRAIERHGGAAAVVLLAGLWLGACGGSGGDAGGSGAGGPSGTGGGSSASASASVSTGTGAGGAGAGGGGGGGGGASNTDIPGGGVVLFTEAFEDTDFASRGWYDGPSGTLDDTEHTGGARSFQCAFAPGATSCSGGKPARHKLDMAVESVYLSFHIKFSANWVGSGKPYHPHMFHFLTDADGDYIGPSSTHLTTYTEIVAGDALLGLQDSLNVDPACILKNDDTFVGCGGDFATFPFTEARSVCSCNGLLGDLDGRDCFADGNGGWYSSRTWKGKGAFVDAMGPAYKNDWHFVEVYFAMNGVQGGVGVPDGKIRWVQDGKTLIAHDKVLMRTGANANLRFNQFAMLPYIGDGSPVAQSFWIDDLTVATAKP